MKEGGSYSSPHWLKRIGRGEAQETDLRERGYGPAFRPSKKKPGLRRMSARSLLIEFGARESSQLRHRGIQDVRRHRGTLRYGGRLLSGL